MMTDIMVSRALRSRLDMKWTEKEIYAPGLAISMTRRRTRAIVGHLFELRPATQKENSTEVGRARRKSVTRRYMMQTCATWSSG